MRKVLPATFLAALILISFTNLNAQKDRFAYAITDLTKEGAGWNALRRIDLQTGQYSSVLLNGTDQQAIVYDATSKKQLTLQADARFGTSLQAPFSTGVAAAAYDKKHNRLYFTPMFVDQLRYIDLKTMKVYYVTDQPFTTMGSMHNDEAKVITRMVIAPDGDGYAISNDGNTFIRFSTDKRLRIEQLGSLVDAPTNNGTSIHNRCSSFGGDMIADDKGNLFILSARNQVFKVAVASKVATYLGAIKNLPPNFTVNGAVVDADGSLVVGSAVDASSYYIVNIHSWSASPYQTTTEVFRSSDLANSNFLSTEKRNPLRPEIKDVQLTKFPVEKFSKLISVYPNPVTENNLTLQFNKVPSGDYTIELTDILGRSVLQKRVTINAEEQTQPLSLNRFNAKGTYLVKLFDKEKQSVYSQKVLVQ